jgi:hypothetical protein
MSLLSCPQPCKRITLRGASWMVILNLASLIPLAIIGATRFYTVLVTILGKSLSLRLVRLYLSVRSSFNSLTTIIPLQN